MVAIEEEIPGNSITADPTLEPHSEMIKEDESLTEEKNLRYLGFIHLATLQSIVYFGRIYAYARENSGPLKPRVDTIEGTAKTIIGPVYHKFHQVPYDFLQFVDRKVEEAVGHVQPSVKKAPEIAKNFVTSGTPTAEECAVGAWKALHRLPLFPQAVRIAVPVAARVLEKYNSAVSGAVDQGFSIAAVLPLVPTSKISKIFGNSFGE